MFYMHTILDFLGLNTRIPLSNHRDLILTTGANMFIERLECFQHVFETFALAINCVLVCSSLLPIGLNSIHLLCEP